MSSNTGPSGYQDWPDYWQNTNRARDREDANLAHEHGGRVDQVNKGLTELFQRRAELLSAIEDVDANISYRQAEIKRLSDDYERRKVILQAQRQGEDRAQQSWFARAQENRERGLETERAMPQDHSVTHNFNRTLPNPAPGWASVNPSPRRSTRGQEQRSDLFSNIFHNPIEEEDTTRAKSRLVPPCDQTPYSQAGMSIRAVENPAGGDARDSLAKSNQERHSLSMYSIPTGRDESPEGSRLSSHGRKSLPSVKDSASQMNSPVPEPADANLREITRDTLVLRDNGSTLVYPAMFAGVPLDKIDENHPFWNPEWGSLEQTIQSALVKWKEKHEALRNDADAVRHTMFLANRQVNRGQSVIDFLRDGCFHPLQFASREMMDKSYKTFTNYDTIFRLVNAHEELKKFDLEVTPLEWLRQRFHEIATAQGDKFSLSKTTHNLYHDPKLKALREKHGFGNIGRPSGYKVGEKGGAKGSGKGKARKESFTTSPEEQASDNRRRRRRSIGQVDAEDDEPLNPIASAKGEPATPRSRKRRRSNAAMTKPEDSPGAQETEPAQADLEYEGYSSRDSFSHGRIMHLDFRVYQIKTRAITTRKDVTQYWTWKPEEHNFEHQVLRDVHPNITWGNYREPNKFNCRLDEMKEIRYAVDGEKVLITRTDEALGDVLVYFKRERTKKRFLSFTKKKGVKLVKMSCIHLEEAWDAMNSEMMSDGEASM
ncbi:hypothetical protein GGR50DRAFT_349189 [Xylaria sp. CBS 124048]|nr:hypothetical protein GGR50DRAFT_349189 [Xylaria sp. CBS 124048]